MKTLLSLTLGGLICVVHASPKFVTPSMILRNGLTDEQYEMLWKQGRNPRIDVATARDLIFRAGRYQNVTNWLEVCGRSNDFARLSYRLQDENSGLVETNKALKAFEKQIKDLKKAASKDGKNLKKLRGDLEKYRDKASTAEFAATCQMLLDLLPVPN